MIKEVMTLELNKESSLDFFINDDEVLDIEASMNVHYNKNSDTFILLNDIVSEGIITLKNALARALKGEAQLPDELVERGVGYWFNIDCTKLPPDSLPYDLLNYSLWGTVDDIGNSTWLYNVEDKIILEISPTYKWHFGGHENVPGYYSLEKFMESYKTIDRQAISKETAEKWLKQCCELDESYFSFRPENYIFKLENDLLKPEVRLSAERISGLLAGDFFEFGSSGRVYNYTTGDVFDDNGETYEMQDFKALRLDYGCVLAIYKAIKKDPEGNVTSVTLRSSIWKRFGRVWKMVFHQGTPINYKGSL